jgi:hypothetical protein
MDFSTSARSLAYKWINNHKDKLSCLSIHLVQIFVFGIAWWQRFNHGNILLFDKRGHGLSDNADVQMG